MDEKNHSSPLLYCTFTCYQPEIAILVKTDTLDQVKCLAGVSRMGCCRYSWGWKLLRISQ